MPVYSRQCWELDLTKMPHENPAFPLPIPHKKNLEYRCGLQHKDF